MYENCAQSESVVCNRKLREKLTFLFSNIKTRLSFLQVRSPALEKRMLQILQPLIVLEHHALIVNNNTNFQCENIYEHNSTQ